MHLLYFLAFKYCALTVNNILLLDPGSCLMNTFVELPQPVLTYYSIWLPKHTLMLVDT
jgi:hypothetical protein